MPNYMTFHNILVYGTLHIERESDSIRKTAVYEHKTESLMHHNTGHGIQGLHAPNPSIHTVGGYTHHDADLLAMSKKLGDCAAKARLGAADAEDSDEPSSVNIGQGCGKMSQIMIEFMGEICDSLGLESSVIDLDHEHLSVPVLHTCSAEEMLQWFRAWMDWMGLMYSEVGRLDTLGHEGFLCMSQEEKSVFSSRILACAVHMQTMIKDVLEEVHDTFSHENDTAKVVSVMLNSVIDTMVLLHVDCMNRLVWFYTPFIRRHGIEYIVSILQGKAPSIPDSFVDEVFEPDSQDHPLGSLMGSSECVLADQRDVEEVFRYSCDQLICLLKGEECGRAPRDAVHDVSTARDVAEGTTLFKSFSSIFFMHGFLKMIYSSGDTEVMGPLCAKIAPLDSQGIKVVHRSIRNAAIAMVALKEGMMLIEGFAAGLRRDLWERSGGGSRDDVDAQCTYFECTCKSAFLDYVMWQLNCWTFGKSPYLAHISASKLMSTAGPTRGSVLINLMKKGEGANAEERLRVSYLSTIVRCALA